MANDAASRRVANWHSLSELGEIAAAACLSAGIALLMSRSGRVSAILAFGSVLLVLSIASRLRTDALDKDLMARKHEVTPQRLATLEALGVETDILEALQVYLKKPALPARDLIRGLESSLGRERVGEKLQMILRYTRTAEGTEQGQPSAQAEGDGHSARATA
jgi:hypothetical protein